MANILISPSKYIQGPGELKNLGTYALKYGKKALALTNEFTFDLVGEQIKNGFLSSGCELVFEYFHGECCKTEIERLSRLAENTQCDIILGIGGGKILDTAKAVSYYTNLPVLICPTSASTDAPCSAISVIYSETGVFEKYLFLTTNPNLVLMDTEIIANSPVRLTVSGMGDALATYFEARAALSVGALNSAGGTPTSAAMALAKLCFDTLMEEGVKAKFALEAHACTQAVEKIIEANTLLSGIGFESGGLAAAHAVYNGFTVLEECRSKYHGEIVAFGTIVQLVLENASNDELENIITFCIDVGLPVTLKELGMEEVTKEKIMAAATAACAPTGTIHNMPFAVNPEKVYSAILAADAYGTYFLG